MIQTRAPQSDASVQDPWVGAPRAAHLLAIRQEYVLRVVMLDVLPQMKRLGLRRTQHFAFITLVAAFFFITFMRACFSFAFAAAFFFIAFMAACFWTQ